MRTDSVPARGRARFVEANMRLGLTWRTAIAGTLVTVIVAGAFTFLIVTISRQRHTQDMANDTLRELSAANDLERIVVDLETGVRGFIITREPTFLAPWDAARAAYPVRSRQWLSSIDETAQKKRAERITDDIESYIAQYSVPLVQAAQRGDPAASSVATAQTGKTRIDMIRHEFDQFRSTQRALLATQQTDTEHASTRAIIAAALSVGLSILLIAGAAAYFAVAIVRPIRRMASLAGEVAEGDLTARVPETGAAEIGHLEHSFNRMARSLETNRAELSELVAEQTALRRVATLVARAAPPYELFAAVTSEINGVLSSDIALLYRYEPDGSAVIVGAAGEPYIDVTARAGVPVDGENIAAMVFETGAAVSVTADATVGGVAARMRVIGYRSATGAPVVVENRLWGAVVVGWKQSRLLPPGIQANVGAFTEIVATAVANAQTRADLEASRARVVAAADETRRRIERDLHDGTQQRLVTLGLELRAAREMLPPGSSELEARLDRLSAGLTSTLAELQELSRGVHPAILSRGGLIPALRSLARRAALPVELDLHIDRLLHAAVEVGVYYTVSEALANAAKHAQASVVRVRVTIDQSTVEILIRDDGVGGADPEGGSGLIGLRDRIEALGGTLEIVSPKGGGTTLHATIPLQHAAIRDDAPSPTP
jgi:signal transduction histidine kinase